MYGNEPDIDHFRLSIFRPDGSPIWPARFPANEIEKLRVKYGPAMFALQYENRCIGMGITETDESWLRYYSVEVDPHDGELWFCLPAGRRFKLKHLTRFTFVDPCFSPDNGDARSAILTLGLTPDEPYNIILLDAEAKKVAPGETIEIAREHFLKWDPIFVSIETVAGQAAFFWWCIDKFPDMPMRELKPERGKTKDDRIRSGLTFFQQGRVFVGRHMIDFLEEFLGFPKGRTKDLLDAFAYGPKLWHPPEPGQDVENDYWDDYDRRKRPTGSPAFIGRNPVTGY
jgi:hypothetical protein